MITPKIIIIINNYKNARKLFTFCFCRRKIFHFIYLQANKMKKKKDEEEK
jgi:hypothetical protein